MPISPHKDETQSQFMSRCVPEMIGTGPDKRPQEQAVAACLTVWRDKDKRLRGKAMDPEDMECDPADYDDRDEFMSDCIDECGDEDQCATMWAERTAKAIVHKTHVSDQIVGMEFVLSDETVDRMDDVIVASGWDLTSFKKSPVALFNHRQDFPIGRWRDLRIENNQLLGHLELARKGTSARINEIISLVEQGILKAVSVGFRPLEAKEREGSDWGSVYTRSELVECSLVSVPANPNALAVAKSLNVSPTTLDLVFAEHGTNNTGIRRRRFTGEHASRSRNGKGSAMSGLAQRITDLETQIVAKRDLLEDHLANIDDSNVSDADLEKTRKFNDEIRQLEHTRNALVDSEKLLARNLTDGSGNAPSRSRSTSPAVIMVPAVNGPAVIVNRKKDLDLLDYAVRAAVVTYLAKAQGYRPEEARLKAYGDDEGTRVYCDLVTRAASAPALTTVTGWAAELAQTTYADLMPLLMPKAILTRLAPRGLTLSFNNAGRIVIPTRSATPTIAGSFVGEGAPIPVRQGAFTSQTLTPKKMAVISTWTREMSDHSIPAIEGLIREAIQQDTSVAIDSVLLDANAATTIRPAGLLNGVAATTATAITNGALAALVGDITNLINAISTATKGNVRNLVWIANQTDLLRASLITATNTGIFPFREEIGRGTLNGIPIIDSATVTAKTLILVDAADFVVAGGEAPRMEMSDQATLHMEDTTPLELVASPSTVAAPQRSLFQTDSLALRMVMPLNWVQRRTGTVAWTQNVTW